MSMQLIRLIADKVDKNRQGCAIEIGIGTDNFYSYIFNDLKFKTIAVDPIPFQPFVDEAKTRNIIFDETCIYEDDGEIDIFTSTHSDLSSVHENWWGINGQTKRTVRSKTLLTLLNDHQTSSITFFKVDTEGAELEIIKQFSLLEKGMLPQIVEFEYGGGHLKKTGLGGWSDEFYNKNLEVLHVLKKLGYSEGLIFDSLNIDPVYFSIVELNNFDSIFADDFEYGNIVIFKNEIDLRDLLNEELLIFQNGLLKTYINELHLENDRLQKAIQKAQLFKRLKRKIKRILFNK